MSGDHNKYRMKVKVVMKVEIVSDGDLRFTQDETNELINALEEAVHFIVPTEKDMQRRAKVRRIVKALEMLKERNEKRETS